MREHYHLILMGNYADNLDEKILKFLVETIVKTINMNILGGPYIHYSNVKQNEGYTVLTAIDTSHISIHTWNTGEFQFDLYSCKQFNVESIIHILEEFSVYNIKTNFFERDYVTKSVTTSIH
tara:strand:- start:380 stop:745 length:366 start_codon:yes stop_codon:yes gene_type:complete